MSFMHCNKSLILFLLGDGARRVVNDFCKALWYVGEIEETTKNKSL